MFTLSCFFLYRGLKTSMITTSPASPDVSDLPPPTSFTPIIADVREKEMLERQKKASIPTLNPIITDIRFQKDAPKAPQKRSNSTSRGMAPKFPPQPSKAPEKKPSPPTYYNRGRPRTYLSDRHSRNLDCRESSSSNPPVSFGYQYPSTSQQRGTYKKMPKVEKKVENNHSNRKYSKKGSISSGFRE